MALLPRILKRNHPKPAPTGESFSLPTQAIEADYLEEHYANSGDLMSESYAHFKITLQGGKQTSCSLHVTLARLLALSIDRTPGTRGAHLAVRLWIDGAIRDWPAFDPDLPISRQITHLALLQIARSDLVSKLDSLISGEVSDL